MGARHAVFIDSEPPSKTGGGIRTYTQIVTAWLRAANWRTTIYTHNPDAYPAAGGLDVFPIGRRPWPEGWARFLRPLAYRFAYDDVVAFGTSLWLAQTLASRDKPGTAYEFCDFEGYAYHSLKNPRLAQRITVKLHTPHHRIQPSLGLRWREEFSLRHAGTITFPSPDFARQHFPRLRGTTVYNPPPEWTADAERRLNQALRPRFLYVGRWEARKGLHILLDAFSAFRQSVPEAVLHVIGDSPSGADAETIRSRLAYREGLAQGWLSVEPGRTGDKSGLYADADILVVPSLWENAPYVYAEGLAHGLVGLGSHTGDMIPAQAAVHGIRIEPGSVKAWEKALNEVWQRRDQAPEWRRRQKQWLLQRHHDAYRQTLDQWAQGAVSRESDARESRS